MGGILILPQVSDKQFNGLLRDFFFYFVNMCLPSEVASLFVWVEVISESTDVTESVNLFKVREYITLYLLVVMHKDDLYLHVCGKKKF